MTSLRSGVKLGLMKKLSLYIFLVLMWCNVGVADDISEYQIEGISIGDSLLNHLSEEEIINEIEIHKPAYNYLSDEFGEVYIFSNFEIYDKLAFFVKPNDKNYKIYFVRGMIDYDDNIEKCYAKQKEIAKELSLMFNNTKISEYDFLFPWDPTGKSHMFHMTFIFNSGNRINISCSEYEKSLKVKNNWIDGLSVAIITKQVQDWLENHIN